MWILTLALGLWPGAAAGQDDAARGVKIAVIPQAARAAEGFDAAQSAGLFIGVRQFEDGAFAEVPYAVDDAVDLAHLFALDLELIAPRNVFLSLAGEPQKPASRDRLKTLLDAGASRQSAEQSDIYKLLADQGSRSGTRGLFVVALATHGFSDQGSDYLVASDSLRRRITRTGIAVNEAFEDVAKARAERRVVLLDACRERLSPSRGSGTGQLAMSRSFATAIARAAGQAVLSGTTEGGYSYDDPERRNGVFTAAVLDGLYGRAPADERSFITVRRLAEFVDRQVIEWVRRHRPEHARISRGISVRLEAVSVAEMPLAVNPEARERHRKIDATLARLRDNIGGPISGAMYDEMAEVLRSPEVPQDLRHIFVEEIEALDGGERLQRSLRDWFNEHREALRGGAPQPTPPHPGREWTEAALGMRIRYVPAGTFRMGSPKDGAGRDSDETPHMVTLTRGSWMGEREVTQGQWRQLMKNNPSEFQSCGDECPVETVSWWDAVTFANRLSERAGLETCYELDCQGNPGKKRYTCTSATLRSRDCDGFRLPTEAEWERAARAETETATYAGDALKLEDIAWCGDNSENKTHPVGGRQPNDWELHDMLGNVWEWVEDAGDWAPTTGVTTDTYAGDAEDPLSTRGPGRVYRGGSFAYGARYCRAAHRSAIPPGGRNRYVGFRVLRTSD